MMILAVRLEMLGEVIDSFAENRDLDFWAAGVFVVRLVLADEGGLSVFRQCHFFLHARPSELPDRRMCDFYIACNLIMLPQTACLAEARKSEGGLRQNDPSVKEPGRFRWFGQSHQLAVWTHQPDNYDWRRLRRRGRYCWRTEGRDKVAGAHFDAILETFEGGGAAERHGRQLAQQR